MQPTEQKLTFFQPTPKGLNIDSIISFVEKASSTLDPAGLIKHLQKDLDQKSDPKVKDWWEKYVKGASFRGVKMAQIRKSVNRWIKEFSIDDTDPLQQFDLGVALIKQSYSEDKLAGILFIQEHLNKKPLVPWQIQLQPYSTLFEQGHLADWNVVDWFCVKVMGPLAKENGRKFYTNLEGWTNAQTVWQRRASVVSYVNLAQYGDQFFDGFFNELLARCDFLLGSQERFIQTGTGWVIREMSKNDPERIYRYLKENKDKFTAEGLRYASEKLSSSQKQTLRS